MCYIGFSHKRDARPRFSDGDKSPLLFGPCTANTGHPFHNTKPMTHLVFEVMHLAAVAWAAAGELITAGAILWALNTLANAIRTTYQAGYAFGKFYRAHLHAPLKWLVLHLIALIITIMQYAWLGAVWLWTNRELIREQIGQAFSYRYESVQYAF